MYYVLVLYVLGIHDFTTVSFSLSFSLVSPPLLSLSFLTQRLYILVRYLGLLIFPDLPITHKATPPTHVLIYLMADIAKPLCLGDSSWTEPFFILFSILPAFLRFCNVARNKECCSFSRISSALGAPAEGAKGMHCS